MKEKKPESKLIAEFNKNANEIIKVQLTERYGYQLLDIRVWVLREGAEAIPTKKGLTLRVERIGNLKEAVDEAAERINKAQRQL